MSDIFEKNWEELGKEWAKRKIEELQSSLDSSLSLLQEQGKFIDNVEQALAKADQMRENLRRLLAELKERGVDQSCTEAGLIMSVYIRSSPSENQEGGAVINCTELNLILCKELDIKTYFCSGGIIINIIHTSQNEAQTT